MFYIFNSPGIIPNVMYSQYIFVAKLLTTKLAVDTIVDTMTTVLQP